MYVQGMYVCLGEHTYLETKGLYVCSMYVCFIIRGRGTNMLPDIFCVCMFGLITYILCFRRLVSIWQASPGSPPIKVCMYVCMSRETYIRRNYGYVCMSGCVSGETYIPRKF